jgi:hypothetical protein
MIAGVLQVIHQVNAGPMVAKAAMSGGAPKPPAAGGAPPSPAASGAGGPPTVIHLVHHRGGPFPGFWF